VVTGALYAADSRWLQKTSFDEYLQSQITLDINRDIRAIEKEITDIDLRLQYESLTPERRAILEASKVQLETQKADLERQLSGG